MKNLIRTFIFSVLGCIIAYFVFYKFTNLTNDFLIAFVGVMMGTFVELILRLKSRQL